MAGRALALFAVLLTAAFAGCSGKGGGPTESDGPSSTIVAGLEPVEDAGSISGLVIDDSQLPIVGASAAILELSLEATTDEGGRFLIGNLAPATYTVAVGKLGYSQAVKKVVVGPSEAVEKTFILEAVAVEEAGSQIFGPYTGFLVCGFVRPGVQGVVGTTTYDCGDVSAGGERPLG
ncbi:MAG TPA: carboxypeptidase regulatory-like domain-containing protein, partial [Candidatus Thermoplasmatota archaeon]|nr:carboxypeptidase regulatory-like domain-containing protein [Candidatus Thermoplasmatota archaeon]